mmetsp:Transcript_16016/g.55665  ORF Transcript_16016/g.55665 Transcript_16016/m.55665 type:complete len:209 (-) Transcript_16016:283-909(-)
MSSFVWQQGATKAHSASAPSARKAASVAPAQRCFARTSTRRRRCKGCEWPTAGTDGPAANLLNNSAASPSARTASSTTCSADAPLPAPTPLPSPESPPPTSPSGAAMVLAPELTKLRQSRQSTVTRCTPGPWSSCKQLARRPLPAPISQTASKGPKSSAWRARDSTCKACCSRKDSHSPATSGAARIVLSTAAAAAGAATKPSEMEER